MTTETKEKKAYIETYGCQMNVYDTELVKTILKKDDYQLVENELDADVVMLNTCSIRENANTKIYNRVHNIRQKREGKPVKIGILGCMATNLRKKLLDNKSINIDFIAGPDSYKQLPTLIDGVIDTGEKKGLFTLSEYETYSDILPTRHEGVNAWIAIMRGCNNYCTYCVVPHTRGRERSRDPENIVEEVKKLVEQGFKQVTLLGQNVNSYNYEDKVDFTRLMEMVSDVDGVERIRFTSPHPKDFPTKLLKLMAERDNICNQIHLPLQAGNNRILEKMNRTYTREEVFALVDEIREIIPNIVLTTDVIVGFCSETPEEYDETVDAMQRIRFDSAYIFKYSERENTLAQKRYPDDVTEKEKTRRITQLVDLQRQISTETNHGHIGQTQTVLIEATTTKKSDDMMQARNDGNKIVVIPKGDHQVGDMVQVRITGASTNALIAELI